MIIILGGLLAAFVILVSKLPTSVSFGDAVSVAGKMGKLNIVDFDFDLSNKYNMWSALLGGTFLFLSYFGTDQSQVSRYLSGKTLKESRLGLLFNGIFKVPMQFMILFIGIMVFMFYQFTQPPIHFNPQNISYLQSAPEYNDSLQTIQLRYDQLFEDKKEAIDDLIVAMDGQEQGQIDQAQSNILAFNQSERDIRSEVDELLVNYSKKYDVPKIEEEDTDYVFISFVTNHLPKGLIGLLLAVIFAAAMSSVASELNALASCTTVDFYRRRLGDSKSDNHYLNATKFFTLLWGAAALTFANFASLFDNLIEFVNIIGSLFYGTILGIFLVAFFLKNVRSNPVFFAAVIAEILVLIIFGLDYYGIIKIAYLWLNLIGCMIVVLLSLMFESMSGKEQVQPV